MTTTRSLRKLLVALAATALFAAGCGGGDGDGDGGSEDAGPPQRGGSIVYGLEAETPGGYCLPEAQLAISGIQVARSMFDTLTVPGEDGKMVPYLARKVTHSEDYMEWTIELRDGITFHDGSKLDAEVVKNNLDAVRGKYEGRNALLGVFVFSDVDTIEITGPLSLVVTTKRPWVAFDSYLFGSGRFGMMAQAQLDDPDTCDRKPIGTGPFKFVSWTVGDSLKVERNPKYWQKAPDGKRLPYLDAIEFRPIAEGEQRVNSLQSGEATVIHTSSTQGLKTLEDLEASGTVGLYQSTDFAEVGYVMLNASKPPFDDQRVRQALAYGSNREESNEVLSEGRGKIASGPFAPGNLGYLKDAGFPDFDAQKAKDLLDEYEQDTGKKLEFTLNLPPDPELVQAAQYLQSNAKKNGVTINLRSMDQGQLINSAISGDFQATFWRNHPGGDPDGQYVWWKSDSPVNFGRINDPEIDRLLDEGRSEPDPAKRKEIYEQINREFGEKVWNIWASWTTWGIGTAPEVHGLPGPELPDGGDPFPGLALGHPLQGLWLEGGG
jgi:peptide/nickel transport system substrate-binding protein